MCSNHTAARPRQPWAEGPNGTVSCWFLVPEGEAPELVEVLSGSPPKPFRFRKQMSCTRSHVPYQGDVRWVSGPKTRYYSNVSPGFLEKQNRWDRQSRIQRFAIGIGSRSRRGQEAPLPALGVLGTHGSWGGEPGLKACGPGVPRSEARRRRCRESALRPSDTVLCYMGPQCLG